MVSNIILFSAILALANAEIHVHESGTIMCRTSCGHCRRRPGHKFSCVGCPDGKCSDGHDPCKSCRNTGETSKHWQDLFVHGMEDDMDGVYSSPGDHCQRCDGKGRGIFLEIEASGHPVWCPFCGGTGTARLTKDDIKCPDCQGKQPNRGYTCMCPECKPCDPKCKKPQYWDEDGRYHSCQEWGCGKEGHPWWPGRACHSCAGTGRLVTKFVKTSYNADLSLKKRSIVRTHVEGQEYTHWCAMVDGERCDQCEGGEFTLTRAQCEAKMAAVQDDQALDRDVEGVLRSFLLCSKCAGTGTQIRYKYVARWVSPVNSDAKFPYRCTNFPEESQYNGKWTKA